MAESCETTPKHNELHLCKQRQFVVAGQLMAGSHFQSPHPPGLRGKEAKRPPSLSTSHLQPSVAGPLSCSCEDRRLLNHVEDR